MGKKIILSQEGRTMLNCKMYLSKSTEVFEYMNTALTGRPCERLTLPFLESLLSFLELDLLQMAPSLTHTIDLRSGVNNVEGEKDAAHASEVLGELSDKHLYFKLLYLEWCDFYSRFLSADTSNRPELWQQLDRLWSLPEQWIPLQKQVLHFIEKVLDIDEAGRDTQRQMVSWYRENSPNDLTQMFSCPISLGVDAKEESHFSPVLHAHSISDLVVFSLRTCVERRITLRRCIHCGRYFPQTGRVSAEYCSRPTREGKTTCKEIGAFQRWTKKHEDDPIFKVYRREYKRRFAWIKAGRISQGDFQEWSKRVREKKKDCENGSISLAEYEDWLKNS